MGFDVCGDIKLSDFGLAKCLDGLQKTTDGYLLTGYERETEYLTVSRGVWNLHCCLHHTRSSVTAQALFRTWLQKWFWRNHTLSNVTCTAWRFSSTSYGRCGTHFLAIPRPRTTQTDVSCKAVDPLRYHVISGFTLHDKFEAQV